VRFLAILLWAGLVLIGGLFAYRNWTPVTFNLWGSRVMDTFLPVPLIVAFILGLLPYFIAYRATRWSLSRKLANHERALAAAQQSGSVAVTSAPATSVGDGQ
jgi:lipopolysaccharide assembly protein A